MRKEIMAFSAADLFWLMTEMDDHLGYGKSERVDRSEQTDYRNGTKQK